MRVWPICRRVVSLFLLAALMGIGFAFPGAEEQKSCLRPTPHEVLLYRSARTLNDGTPTEIRSDRDLRNLQPAESQRELPVILKKVGETMAGYVDNFPNIAG
jgi:hypothetical protein